MISIIQPRLPGELAATVASFPVDIPVEPGDLIGLETGSGAGGDYPEGPPSGTPADVRGDVLGAPTTGQTVGTGGEYAVEGLTPT